MFQATDCLVYVCQAQQRYWEERAVRSRRRNEVIYNGVDTAHWMPMGAAESLAKRRELGLADEDFVIGLSAVLRPEKNHLQLVEAVAALRQRGVRARALMIGDGPQRRAAYDRVESTELRDCVAFTGLVPQEDGPRYLAACDILASPHVPNPDGSPFFGSPTKLFEYMAMGRAIVASELGQIGVVLRHGETGWLVPPGDVGALAAGLERLVDDPSLRRRLGGAARQEVATRHTWRAHVERTIEALAGRTGPRSQ